jgi:hypothetical protein
MPWQGPLFRLPLIPAIFTRFAMTARFFGWSTTLGSRWRRSHKTISEKPGRGRDLDSFRSRMSPAAENSTSQVSRVRRRCRGSCVNWKSRTRRPQIPRQVSARCFFNIRNLGAGASRDRFPRRPVRIRTPLTLHRCLHDANARGQCLLRCSATVLRRASRLQPPAPKAAS